jgi:hypothetical protein
MILGRTQRFIVSACVVLAAVGLVCFSGCGPGGYSGPTGTVGGTVTIGEDPAPAGCTVAFISDEGFTASAVVGADGKYELKVSGENPTSEIPVAKYRICVTPPADSSEPSEADYEAMMNESASGGEGSAEASPTAVIPAKYHTTGTSGLSYDVTEGANTHDIVLE